MPEPIRPARIPADELWAICPTCGHPMRCPACTGGQGGRSTSPKKAAAAKANASKPRTTQETTMKTKTTMTEQAMLAYVERMRAAQQARAYFCPTCQNWQLRASHPGRCPKEG